MKSRMVIIVNFRSAHGGLHDHVADQVGFAAALGYDVTLACPAGPFATRMAEQCDVVTIDAEDPSGSARSIVERARPDLIHAHPGLAREIAFAVKESDPVPVLVTYHGSRPETLTAADPRVDIAIVVSDVTRRFVLKRTEADPARVIVIPNAVDTEVFAQAPIPAAGRDVILMASRWDDDKAFVVEVALEAIQGVADSHDLEHVDVVVAGDGTRLGDLRDACETVNAARGRESFRTVGWLDASELAREIALSSVVLSPGRGALQAMAVGRATVALGSKGYVGFLGGGTLLQGIDANFGSGGIGPRKYPRGLVIQDLRHALSRARDKRLVHAYQSVARERSLPMIQQAHATVWAIAAAGMGS